MIALFVIGILVFTGKLIHFALKAAWGITKSALFVIGIPALLTVLFVGGLVSLAIPLLLLALLTAYERIGAGCPKCSGLESEENDLAKRMLKNSNYK